jgi:hypothetical protein
MEYGGIPGMFRQAQRRFRHTGIDKFPEAT